MRAISLDEANAIIAGTFAAAAEHKCHALAAIVLDAGGRVKAFQKQDGASLMRFEVAYGKAFAALAMGRSSRMVLQKQREKPVFIQNLEALADGPMFLEGGGQLIRDETGEVVGAVGVTGDVNEMDDICAIAGIRAASSVPTTTSTSRRRAVSTSRRGRRSRTRGEPRACRYDYRAAGAGWRAAASACSLVRISTRCKFSSRTFCAAWSWRNGRNA